MTYVGNTMSSE